MASKHLLEQMVQQADPSTDPSVEGRSAAFPQRWRIHLGTRGSATVALGVVPPWDSPSATVRHKPLVHPLAEPSVDPDMPALTSDPNPTPVDNSTETRPMTRQDGVWVEHPGDDGSAVWGCSACERGGWCSDHTSARMEARTHARLHGTQTPVETLNRPRGPKPNKKRDARIIRLRTEGATVRTIAAIVKMSHAGVVKALRRLGADA